MTTKFIESLKAVKTQERVAITPELTAASVVDTEDMLKFVEAYRVEMSLLYRHSAIVYESWHLDFALENCKRQLAKYVYGELEGDLINLIPLATREGSYELAQRLNDILKKLKY